MERVEWSITTQYWEGSSEQFLFTYSEEEREEARLNKMNAELVLKPKFIPVYPSMLQNGYSLIEATIYGFIDFFLSNNEKFYCTNEQIGEMLNVGITSVSQAINKLKENGLIDISYKIKWGGGKVRFIHLSSEYKKIESMTFRKWKSDIQNVKGIENKIIENKIIDNNIYTPWEKNNSSLNTLAVSKERKVAVKERKLAMDREEYSFVWEFLDKENPITAYCYSKYPDYEGSQMEAVDKLVKQGYPLELIKLALMYIKQDKFWSKNILSVKKLLEKNRDGIPYMVTIIQQMKDYKPVVAEL